MADRGTMTSSTSEDDPKKSAADLQAETSRKRKRLSAVLDKLTTQVERRGSEVVTGGTHAQDTEREESPDVVSVAASEPPYPKVRPPPQKQISVDSDISLSVQTKLGLRDPTESGDTERTPEHLLPPPPSRSPQSPVCRTPTPASSSELSSPVESGVFFFERKTLFRPITEETGEDVSPPKGGSSPTEGPAGLFTPPTSDSASGAGGSRGDGSDTVYGEQEQTLSPELEEELGSDDPFFGESGQPSSDPDKPTSSAKFMAPEASPTPSPHHPCAKPPLLGSTFPTFPICNCHHCRSLAGRTSGKFAGTHGTWTLSWDEMARQRVLLETMKLAVPSSPISPLTPVSPGFESLLQSRFLPELYRRRSHSDSDLQQWIETTSAESGQGSIQLPPTTEPSLQEPIPGTVMRHGRPVPKPLRIPSSTLHKAGSLESDQSTPQDSPLDLSIKTGGSTPSPRLLSAGPHDRSFSSMLPETLAPPTMSMSVSVSPVSTTPEHEAGGLTRLSLSPYDIPPMVSRGGLLVPKTPETPTSAPPMGREDTSPSAVPPPEVAYVCPICGQMFSLHDRLAKHMASRHRSRQSESSAKTYVCEVCKRSFARSDMLTRHMRLHTGIKPYTCRVCGQVFSRSDHLSTHQRTHTGEKPYKCPQCPYAACRRDMITRHMRTHARYELPDSSSSFEDVSEVPTTRESGGGVGGDESGTTSPTHKLSALTVRGPSAPPPDTAEKD